MKQQKLDMEHEKHKAALDAQQASQQVNMKMLDFWRHLPRKYWVITRRKTNKVYISLNISYL